MPGYIDNSIQHLKHDITTQLQHSPHPWTCPNYSKPTQLTTAPDQSAPLLENKITHLQKAI